LNPRVYISAQVAQHLQLTEDLQKSNARASHLMLRLGRMPLQHHRFKALCEDLTSLERSMTLQIFLCEQLADSRAHKRYDVINVILGTTCDYCLESGKTPKLQNNTPHSEVLTASPAWPIQVERLSGLMISLAHNVSQTSFSPRRTVEQSLRSLARLSTVLSRQRRHMEHISVPQPTKINFIEDHSTVCPDCGHPYTATATDEDEEDQCI
jgi:hypothetical protein